MPTEFPRTGSKATAPIKKTAVKVVDNTPFIDLLVDVVRKGGGFVPFVGSGGSAASGILMGQQFDEYLAFTVFLCIADEESIAGVDTAHSGRWDLRRYGWPRPPTPLQIDKVRVWIRQRFNSICSASGFVALPPEGKVCSLEPESRTSNPDDLAKTITCPLLPRILRAPHCAVNQDNLRRLLPFFGPEGIIQGGYSAPGMSPTSEDAIVERAIRSLYDWRATLHFLSKLKLVGRRTLLVEMSDPAIIDGFNVHITNGRKPNLIHSMLCHLAGPARLRTFLTTNFDTLIEESFQELKEHLAVISVSVKGSLPDPGTVHARNTLVKMHGTLLETRADFSLDESPSLDSKRSFFHYVRGEYPDNETEPHFLPAELLICGYSGSDNRCVEMIKYVLDASDATVYWVCHSSEGFSQLQRLFTEDAYEGRVVATITERCDLLLYEFYQRLCLSLPRGGFSYQYSHNVPPHLGIHKSSAARSEAEKIISPSSGWFCNPDSDEGDQPRRLLVADGAPGILATLQQVVKSLADTNGVSQIWLELEDYQDTYSLAYDLFLILSTRLGLFQLGHADLVPARFIDDCEKCRASQLLNQGRVDDGELTRKWIGHVKFLLRAYFAIVPGKWLVVLYGRNGPGGCSGWTETQFWGSPDHDEEYGTNESVGRFPPFVKALCSVGFHVAYAPYGIARYDQDQPKGKDLEDMLKLHLRTEVHVVSNSAEYVTPPAHHEEAIKAGFSASLEFPGVISYKSPNLECPAPAVSFERCMKSLCEEWVRYSAVRNVPESGRSRFLENLGFLYATTLFRKS